MDGNPVGLEASEAGSFGWNQLGEIFFFFKLRSGLVHWFRVSMGSGFLHSMFSSSKEACLFEEMALR